MLTAINTFSLATHDGEYADWPLTTPLSCDGVPTGTRVPGYAIEGQYRWGEHVLLINSWDCPYEEAYEFLLLDARYRIVSKKQIAVPYGTYLLHAHWPHSESALRLHLYDDDCFTLDIIPPSGWWHRRHRRRLTHHPVAPDDERTQASIRSLRAQLKESAARTEAMRVRAAASRPAR